MDSIGHPIEMDSLSIGQHAYIPFYAGDSCVHMEAQRNLVDPLTLTFSRGAGESPALKF